MVRSHSLNLQPYKIKASANLCRFKGLPNGANFILIDHCVGELLSINKVSSERQRTIAIYSYAYKKQLYI